MGSSNMSYWDVVGLTGARQLLVTSPSGFKSFGSFNALSQDVCADGSDNIRPFPSRRQVRFSNSIEEFIACSAYEDGIDEDDYILTTVDNEIQVEPLIFESLASSDTESSSSDSVGEPEVSPRRSEENITQSEAQDQRDEASTIICVRLPSTKRAYLPTPPLVDNNTRPLEEPEILSIVNITEDEELPDTTVLHLPGMRSRLEITRVTWVREIPLTAPRPSHEYEPQEGYTYPDTRRVACPSPSIVNQHRSRATSDPSSFSSRMATIVPTYFDSHIPMSTFPISCEASPHAETPITPLPLRSPHGHSLSFTALERPQLPRTLAPNSVFALSLNHDDTRDSVMRLATHVPSGSPGSPLHSGSSVRSPASTVAGPSKTLLDILNGSYADTQLPTIPAPHALPAARLSSSQDPPVFKPKPIGSATYPRPAGHRRLSDSSASDVVYSWPAAAPAAGQEAPPWPPVLLP